MTNHHTERVLLNAIHKDKRLSPFHISLFTAMIALWQEQQYAHPFRISRCELMEASRIRSPATYHKCLKALVNRNHILYEPSFDPVKASLVYWPVMKYGEQIEANRQNEKLL
jgi:hypothetical protein